MKRTSFETVIKLKNLICIFKNFFILCNTITFNIKKKEIKIDFLLKYFYMYISEHLFFTSCVRERKKSMKTDENSDIHLAFDSCQIVFRT